jgi:hypothetical protein
MSARSQKPPPLPIEILMRVIRLASTDGRLVLWLSGCFALLSGAGHDIVGAIAGCAAAGAGAIEVHGSTLLRQGETRGLDWVIRAQLVLLASILIYAGARLVSFHPTLISSHITPDVQDKITDLGITREQFIAATRTLYMVVYAVVGFVSLIYQGGMVRYYVNRRTAIEQALHDRSA